MMPLSKSMVVILTQKEEGILSEEWVNLRPDDYQIQPYEIDYPQKFIQINHSAVLGTLANSGIDTDTLVISLLMEMASGSFC